MVRPLCVEALLGPSEQPWCSLARRGGPPRFNDEHNLLVERPLKTNRSLNRLAMTQRRPHACFFAEATQVPAEVLKRRSLPCAQPIQSLPR
jgi:hypothetical protein